MLRDQLNQALKEAMKAKDATALSTLRLIMAAIKDRDIEARSSTDAEPIDDTKIMALLQTMIKQRQDAIKIALDAKRQDIASKEEKEIQIIQAFLPEPMDEIEIKQAIEAAIEATESSSLKDMGAVMAYLKENYVGRMDFGQTSKKVKDVLSS